MATEPTPPPSASAYLHRVAEGVAQRLATGFPVVALTGPRQSGKTTLARRLFASKPYRTLEDPETNRLAQTDPKAFLASFPDGAVLDEIQRSPLLLSYMQGLVDTRQRMGDFVITGSQQFGLLERITQSLAGRIGMVELLPLSWEETSQGASPNDGSLNQVMFTGGYPALFDRRRLVQADLGITITDWHASYLSTYVERDVRQVLGVRDRNSFERFVLMCAARSGQLLNIASLASDCGISASAARQWLSVLEASYVIRLLQPWHENFGKRLVKMPKLYFLDTGLLCYLLRIDSPATLATHAMRGAIFETWVITETIKYRLNRGLRPDVYFWRDNHGVEIDLLCLDKGQLCPVEIKSGTTFSTDWLGGCKRFASYAGGRGTPGTVVYGGDDSFTTQGHQVLAWHRMNGFHPAN